MIDQRTKDRTIALPCATAHASVRAVSMPRVLLAIAHLNFATRLHLNLCLWRPGVLANNDAAGSALPAAPLTMPIE